MRHRFSRLAPRGTTTMPAQLTSDPPAPVPSPYDGTASFPDDGRPPAPPAGRARAGLTILLLVVPFAGLAAAVWLAWGHGLGLTDLLLAGGFYALTGLGVTGGFHPVGYPPAVTPGRPARG